MAIAVGPTYELQVVNDCMAVFNRSGVLQAGFPKSLNTFFGLSANNFQTGQFTSDPRAFYDNVAGRYISANYRDTIVFTVIVLVLFIRPSGVLGAGRKERV